MVLRTFLYDVKSNTDPLGGLIVVASAVAIFFIVPWLDTSKVASIRYKGMFSKIVTLFGVSFNSWISRNCGRNRDKKACKYYLYCNIFFIFLLILIYTKYEKTKEVPERL